MVKRKKGNFELVTGSPDILFNYVKEKEVTRRRIERLGCMS